MRQVRVIDVALRYITLKEIVKTLKIYLLYFNYHFVSLHGLNVYYPSVSYCSVFITSCNIFAM